MFLLNLHAGAGRMCTLVLQKGFLQNGYLAKVPFSKLLKKGHFLWPYFPPSQAIQTGQIHPAECLLVLASAGLQTGPLHLSEVKDVQLVTVSLYGFLASVSSRRSTRSLRSACQLRRDFG